MCCCYGGYLIQVRTIDIGASEIVDVNQLLFLPQEFITIPTQVVEVYINGIKPKDEDLDWPSEVTCAAIIIVCNCLPVITLKF